MLDFLPGSVPEENAAATPVTETPAPEPTASEAGGRPRDPSGRFAPANPAPATETPATGATHAPAPEPTLVPVSAVQGERERRQALEKLLEARERELADMRASRAPDPLIAEEEISPAVYARTLHTSRRFAEREYGKEVVAQVHEWAARRCDIDPVFNKQMRSHVDPYEAAYQAFQAAHAQPAPANMPEGEFAEFQAWKASRASGQAQPAPTPTPQAAARPATEAPVPRTLADAPGNGAAGKSYVPTGPGTAFASAIRR